MISVKIIFFFELLKFFQTTNSEKFNSYGNNTDILPAKNYNGSQLWRIHSADDFLILRELENEYNGVLWRHGLNYTDLSFESNQLNLARRYLENANLTYDILMSNIQELIEKDYDDKDDDNTDENVTSVSHARAFVSNKASLSFNWNRYHQLDRILYFIKEMKANHPNLVTIFSIGKSIQGRKLFVLRISAVQDNGNNERIWIDGGVHAREWISPASVTYIIHNLLANWKRLPNRLTRKVWYIMPMANPDGYVFSHNSDRLWRKNMRNNRNSKCYGVDLNRNFGFKWGMEGSSKNPCSDTYRGSRSFSEPESRAIRGFLRRHRRNLRAYLSFHSYSQIIGYPWGYQKKRVRDYKQLHKVASRAARKIKSFSGADYDVIPIHQLGIASGSDDWARGSLGIKYVYTMELRDKGKYGFLLPRNQILPTAKEALIFVKTIAENI